MFRGQKASFAMTSVLGHVYDCNFPPSLGWSVDPRTLFDAPTVRPESNPEQHICQHLSQVAKGCNALVLWLDCDREGENICFEVMENCEPKMAPKHDVFRARFSAITPQDVNKAMANLGKPNKNEALSVEARREIDLKVGVAFTRYQTTTFHFRYANLDAHLISYGPCQTPTLGFCVDRYDEIQRFRPTSYFKLVAHILRSGIKTKLKWTRNRVMKERSICNGYLSKMTQNGSAWATVKDVKTSTSKLPRPVPLNTVALMKAASTLLGMGPEQCMHIAEHLYINGWISYPRTESSSYPEHFDIYEEIEKHVRHPEWGQVAEKLLTTGLQRAKKGVDHGDHPPITPMSCAHRDRDLSGSEWRLYEYITCHFIATVCPDAVVENQTILYDIGGEEFASNGSSLKSPGFLEVMSWHRPADKYMASVKIGEQHEVDSVSIKEGVTKPPGFITESELISLMEKHGIGTDASIPTHIGNIQRSYVKLHERGRTLEPNKLGIALVHGYHRIDPELVLPKVRANIENMVSKIALGQASYKDVLKTSLDIFLQKFDHFVASIARMDELFEASFSSLGDVQVNTRLKPKCGKCDRYMKYIDTKPHRLYCVNCEQVYSMPKDGSLKSDGSEALCPLDNFELVVHTDRKGKVSRLCPKCYNEPDFPDMKPGQTCSQCPNLSCPYNISRFTVEESCPHCDVGFLSLEPQNGRRIDCNLCQYHIELPNDANKITLSKLKCANCKHNSTKLTFKYSEKNNPQPDKTLLEFAACIRCDPVMVPKTKVKIPGVREPRMPRGRHAHAAVDANAAARSSSTTSNASSAPASKPAETFYNSAAVAAIQRANQHLLANQQEEDDIDYGPRGRRSRGRQQPQRHAPSPSSASLMDFVVVHKTKKTGNAPSASASETVSSAPQSATGPRSSSHHEEEWEQFDPSQLEDVVKLPDITPPSQNASSAPSGHQHHPQQQGRQNQYVNRNSRQGQSQQRDTQHRGQKSHQTNAQSQPNQQRQQKSDRNESHKSNPPAKKGGNAKQTGNQSQSQDAHNRPAQAHRQPNRQQSQSSPRAKTTQASEPTAASSNEHQQAIQQHQASKPSQSQNKQNNRPQVPRSATSAPAYVPKSADAASIPETQTSSAQPTQKQNRPPRAPKQTSASNSNSSSAPSAFSDNAKSTGHQQRGGSRNGPKSSGSKTPQYAPKPQQ